MKTQTPFWRILLATIVFWGLALFGSYLVQFVNWIGMLFADRDVFDNKIVQMIIAVGANPTAMYIAIFAFEMITEEEAYKALLINCVIAATLSAVLILLILLFLQGNTKQIMRLISFAITCGVSIYGIAHSLKEIS